MGRRHVSAGTSTTAASARVCSSGTTWTRQPAVTLRTQDKAAGGRHVGAGQPPGLESKKAAGAATSAQRIYARPGLRPSWLKQRRQADEAAGRRAENAKKAAGHIGRAAARLGTRKSRRRRHVGATFFMHGRVCVRCGRKSGAMTTRLRRRNEKLIS